VNYDRDKVDQMVLALLSLTMMKDGSEVRAWKGHDWESLDRLHAQGYISDPKRKTKSVAFSEEGARRAQELFALHFGSGAAYRQ
jgi:uncharacterized protein DUF6429